MYQCLVCEDWNHHDCVFGTSPSLATNDSTTPPPLSPAEFDSFICHKCVTSNIPLRRILDDWAGAEGRGVIIIDDNKALGKLEEEDEEEATISPAEEAAGSSKRGGEDIAKPTAKRARLSSGQLLSHSSSPPASSLQLPPSSPPPTSSSIPCFLPGLSTSILGRIEKEGGRCNVFLAEDYHIGWCQCEVVRRLSLRLSPSLN
jgi:E3 ubiquitin-protein ligase UBR7